MTKQEARVTNAVNIVKVKANGFQTPKVNHPGNLNDSLGENRIGLIASQCKSKAFNMGVSKELLNIVDVLPKVKTKLIGGYHRIQSANKRSKCYKDDLIKKVLMYLKSQKKQ